MGDYFFLMKAEWMIAGIIFFLLFIKISKGMTNETVLSMVQILLFIICIAGFFFNREGSLFDGMFINSSLITFQKNILCLGVLIISLLFSDWLIKSQHMPEFFILMLSALLGMCLMISSGNLLLFFLSLELSTIPVAAMANFDLDKKSSSESAMKMILSSAFSSGILLFGISLLYGATGTIRFSELPGLLTSSPLIILSFVFLFTAFAFKMSVVPFHLWTADVYEGAPMATTAFLSVISKGAVTFIFISTLYKVFQPLETVWYLMLVILSVATIGTGNLFAVRQKNIKRFLAFSSIAQIGFILLGISSNSASGTSSAVYFVLIYVFSNLAAFGIASIISSFSGKENIDDYKGLYQTNPFLCWVMALSLFSLAGIPPTAGFFGKLYLLTAGASRGNFWIIAFAALNMIISLYYYLRIVRSMFMEKNEQPVQKIRASVSERLALIFCSAAILWAGITPWIYEYIHALK